LEADVGWSVDAAFEIIVRASAASGVRSSIASRYLLPSLRLRLADVTLGPAPVAIAVEAAPQGFPYVGLIALTFVRTPDLDFSAAPLGALSGTVTTVPLVREALTASFGRALPLAEEEEVLVYDLGEYLAPGRRAALLEERGEEGDERRRRGAADARAGGSGARPRGGRWARWLRRRGADARRQVDRTHLALNTGTGRVLRVVRAALQESMADADASDGEGAGASAGSVGTGSAASAAPSAPAPAPAPAAASAGRPPRA